MKCEETDAEVLKADRGGGAALSRLYYSRWRKVKIIDIPNAGLSSR